MPTVAMTVEDYSPMFQWSSDWVAGNSQDSSISLFSQSSCMATNVSGATMSFTFFGKSVQIYGSKRANHGLFQVQLDNTTNSPVNGAAPDPGQFQQQLFSADGLENGVHVVQVTNLNATQYLDVDFVTWMTDIGEDNEKLLVHTIQDSDPSIVWDPPDAWQTNLDKAGTYFGSSGHESSNPGSSMEYKFAGSAVYLFGPVSPNGASYSVILDGQTAGNYSSLSPRYIPQSLLYYAGGLDNGRHTIKVTHTAWQVAPATTQVLGIDFMNLYTTPSIEARLVDRLSPGVIAGITVGTITGLILFLVFMAYHLRRKSPARGRDRDRDHEPKGRSKSRSGLLKVLGGWMSSGLVAKLKKKRKPRNGQPFNIDEVDYARVAVSEREATYLIPQFGPPGASGTSSDGVRGSSVQPSVFSSLAESSRALSYSTGKSDLKQTSLSGVSEVLNQPAATEMGMKGAGLGPQRPGTGGSSSSAQKSPGVFGGSAAAPSFSSQSESSTSGRRYSRANSTMVPSSPLGARPMSSHSQLQSPQSRSQSHTQLPLQPQMQARSSSLQRLPTILPPLPPGAAKPSPPIELASPTSELGELSRVGSVVTLEYDSSGPPRSVGDKKGTLR